MEHPVRTKNHEVSLGFDLERRIILTRDERGQHVTALTDKQIERLRNHWRWICMNPQGGPMDRHDEGLMS